MFSATEKALIHTRLPQWAVAENLGAEESYIHEINRKFSPSNHSIYELLLLLSLGIGKIFCPSASRGDRNDQKPGWPVGWCVLFRC